jgi:hypothetical protein
MVHLRNPGGDILKYKGFIGVVIIFVVFICWGEYLGTSVITQNSYKEVPVPLIVLFLLLVFPVRYFNRNGGGRALILWLVWIIASVVPGLAMMNYEKSQVNLLRWDFLLWEILVPLSIGGVQVIFIIVMYLYTLYHKTKA